MSQKQAYESNELIERLPPHLKQFIKPQNYSEYTPINQAVWRYVMRKNLDFLSKNAHSSYLKGLEKTGISIESIPSMYGMNRILKEIGWAAVAVDGFIPPNAFMEFQAYKILVIASDIRQLENIEYTPAPDIIHEAAGHAPIIANPDYAEYLRRLGAIGAKAILSKHDIDLYEAVRKLSIMEEAEGSDAKELADARNKVEELQGQEVDPSEMAEIRNLQWWTVEYGLIGELESPRIYGAGLLSSIGESVNCLKDEVIKKEFSIEAIHQDFDITKPQPQLFVTPDFSYLMQVLEEYASTMSLRKGGFRGLKKLIESNRVGTIELNTGLQVSGVFTEMIKDEDANVIFFKTEGPSALAFREKELIGHGTEVHVNGFASPLGKLKGINLAIEDMGPVDLKAYNFYDGKHLSFEFESGIKVEGLNLTGIRNMMGKLMLIQLVDCQVSYGERILFDGKDEIFNMAIGTHIISAYAGPADFNSFDNLYEVSKTKSIKAKTENNKELNKLYERVREIRENRDDQKEELRSIFQKVKNDFGEDWLLSVEILELSKEEEFSTDLRKYLDQMKEKNPKLKNLIEDGLELLPSINLSRF